MRWVIRVLLGLVGVLMAAQGVRLLLDIGQDNLLAAAIWLAAGVLVHDGIIVPLTLGFAGLLVLLKVELPGPVVIGLIVLSTVTLATVPMLGRFGARADNATLLDRNYLLGWIVFAGVTAMATALLARRRRQRAKRNG